MTSDPEPGENTEDTAGQEPPVVARGAGLVARSPQELSDLLAGVGGRGDEFDARDKRSYPGSQPLQEPERE